MSFVFDQIDAIEKERSNKDQTLNRIRAWRESKKNPNPPAETVSEPKSGEGLAGREVEVVHPWPEWIEFMERLVGQNYFDLRRRYEAGLVEDAGFRMDDVAEEGFDFTRDWKTVQTACLNFGKDRFDILRSVSRQDIQTLVGHGCPSADKKVVFSAKLLRKHVHLDEGDVCSSCKLRSSCERAYLVTNKEDEARTIDIIRVLLTYGFDPINGSVTNESLLKIKSVKTVVRKLLHEVVKLSAVPIDPDLPPPVIKKPPPKVKIPPPTPKRRVGRDDIEMKMGDWICPKCDFMNFAKNTICRQCDGKRPKRQLLPGEWECPECNFLNYRRNTVCFHCEHKRPPDEFMENQFQDKQHGLRSRPEKVPNKDGVCNAWNFDFDDNESDGADVAAFEYADSHKIDEDFSIRSEVQVGNFQGPNANSRVPRFQDEDYINHGQRFQERDYNKPGTGFDDFDEEEDDIDSYELDTHNNTKVDFSEVEGHSESDDVEGFDQGRFSRQNDFRSNNKSRVKGRTSSLSGSEIDEQDFDSDGDLPVCFNEKSSCAANSRQRSGNSRGKSFSSGDDFVRPSHKGNRNVSRTRDPKRTRSHDSEDELFSGVDSDDEARGSHRDRFKCGNSGINRRGESSKMRGQFLRDSPMRSNRRDTFDNNRGSQRDGNQQRGNWVENGGRRKNERSGYGNQRGGSNGFNRKSDMNSGFEDERYMRPRVNVR